MSTEEAVTDPFPSVLPVIVLNWRAASETGACLDSLRRSRWPLCPVVVDNGSGEDDVKALTAAVANWGFLIRSDENLGFAGGVNLGLSHPVVQAAQWVLLLNNDARLSRNAVREMRATRTDPSTTAAIAPAVFSYTEPRKIESVGGRIILSLGLWPHLDHGKPLSGTRVPREADFAPGACMLVSMRAVERIGALDETYFAYNEEVDWCWRARMAGFRILTAPRAHAWHRVGFSASREMRLYLMVRNNILFMRRHARFYHWPTYALTLAVYIIPAWSAKLAVRRPLRAAGAVLRALRWHTTHRPLPRPGAPNYRPAR